MYKALTEFRDLQDGHLYREGDVFPFDGRAIPASRIDELITGQNRANRRLIVFDGESIDPTPKTRKKAVRTPRNAK